MKYWEMIADKLARDGRTWGVVSYVDGDGRKMICIDAHRDDDKPFVVHAGYGRSGRLIEDMVLVFVVLASGARELLHGASMLAKRSPMR